MRLGGGVCVVINVPMGVGVKMSDNQIGIIWLCVIFAFGVVGIGVYQLFYDVAFLLVNGRLGVTMVVGVMFLILAALLGIVGGVVLWYLLFFGLDIERITDWVKRRAGRDNKRCKTSPGFARKKRSSKK